MPTANIDPDVVELIGSVRDALIDVHKILSKLKDEIDSLESRVSKTERSLMRFMPLGGSTVGYH